jgi:hypothetical protein
MPATSSCSCVSSPATASKRGESSVVIYTIVYENLIPTIHFQSRDQVNRKAMNVTCADSEYDIHFA